MTTTTNPQAEAINEYMAQCNGCENYYTHWLRRFNYTDGVKFVAETASAYWLIDAVASHQGRKLANVPFQVWKLKRNKTGNGAKLTCEDGNGNQVAVQRIQYTDFPMPEITFWLENNVLMLPKER